MLQKIKNFAIDFSKKDFIYIFIIICLTSLTISNCHSRKNPNIEIKKAEIVPTLQKEDKKGNAYTEIKGTIYTQEQMDHVSDSFRKVLGKGKVIQAITAVTSPIHDTVPVTIYIDTLNHIVSASDSNKSYKQTFKGNWLTKKATFTLDIAADTATYITTWKHRIFRPDELTANVYHTNALFKPAFGNVYIARTPKPILDIDLFVGYDPFLKRVVLAPGVGLHLFSIKRKN